MSTRRKLMDVLKAVMIDDIDGSWLTTSRRVILYRDTSNQREDYYYLLSNFRFPFIECHTSVGSILDRLDDYDGMSVSSIHLKNMSITLKDFNFFNDHLYNLSVLACVLRDCNYPRKEEKSQLWKEFTRKDEIELHEHGEDRLKDYSEELNRNKMIRSGSRDSEGQNRNRTVRIPSPIYYDIYDSDTSSTSSNHLLSYSIRHIRTIRVPRVELPAQVERLSHQLI